MRRIFLLTALLISTLWCTAQRFTAFSLDPSLTIDEMKEFSATVPKEKQKEAALLVEEFTALWNSPELDYELQEAFLTNANQMLKKHLRFLPHFQSYIHAYQAFLNSDLTNYHKEWDKITKYLILNDGNTFHTKMNTYTALFTANMLVTSTNSRWRSENAADMLGFDKEPFIEFRNTDLIGCSKQDSLIIYGTTGRYFPASMRWDGIGGEVFWDRAGIGDDVKAVIADYNIDLRQPRFTAENAQLHYPALFGYPLKGRLEDKAAGDIVRALRRRRHDKTRPGRGRQLHRGVSGPGAGAWVDGVSVGHAANNAAAQLTALTVPCVALLTVSIPHQDRAGTALTLTIRAQTAYT